MRPFLLLTIKPHTALLTLLSEHKARIQIPTSIPDPNIYCTRVQCEEYDRVG